jgi:hypothetical protein
MKPSPTDRIAQVKGLVARILYRDARKVMAAGKGDYFSPEEMDAFLAMPDSSFPLVQRGVTFETRAELQVARNAARCKKEVSASMQASMDRIEAFAKGNLLDDKKVPTINVQQMFVAIPQAPQLEAKPENVVTFRRNSRGEALPALEPVAVEK